jgi:tRNA splicing endonuclease
MELQSDKAYFINVHEQNIGKGIAVEESKKAIEEIEKKFQKELAKREAYEAKEIARMQRSLKEALTLEQRKVARLRKKNADIANQEALSKLQELDRYFSQSIQRIADLQQNPYKISIAADK